MKKLIVIFSLFISFYANSELYTADLNITCDAQGDRVQLKLLHSNLTIGTTTYQVTDVSRERSTRMQYNGDYFKKEWPVTDVSAVHGAAQIKLSYFAEKGSKNYNIGRVELQYADEVLNYTHCSSSSGIY